jgi:hypothetical protein
MRRESGGVQAGEPPERSLERMAHCAAVYADRRDLAPLKARLLAAVGDPDYWTTLACFVSGECPKRFFDDAMRVFLRTDDAKRLHNELIRALIFNAHFAARPPDGVAPPAPPAAPPPPPAAPPARPGRPLALGTAADLRHLPSVAQLRDRVAALLAERGLAAGSAAAPALFAALKRYTLRLLECSCALLRAGAATAVAPAHVLHAVAGSDALRSVVSPTLLQKFSVSLNSE